MKFALVLLLISLNAVASPVTAFFVKEYTSGTNKICVYNLLGEEYIITIKNTDLCRQLIKVDSKTKRVIE